MRKECLTASMKTIASKQNKVGSKNKIKTESLLKLNKIKEIIHNIYLHVVIAQKEKKEIKNF